MDSNIIPMVKAARQQNASHRMDKALSMIFVQFQKEGIHCYPAAATDPNLSDVKFLANEHRHIFHFTIWIEVFHSNRDIEFIQFKRWLENLYSGKLLELNFKSCEMIADELFLEVAVNYPARDVWIEISEDGENGCFKQYNKE